MTAIIYLDNKPFLCFEWPCDDNIPYFNQLIIHSQAFKIKKIFKKNNIIKLYCVYSIIQHKNKITFLIGFNHLFKKSDISNYYKKTLET